MPIRMYLAGRTFDPELIQHMSVAFQDVCHALNLKPVDDAVTRLVAEKIIALADTGVRGRTALCLMTVQEFKRTDQGDITRDEADIEKTPAATKTPES
jgi:hypothetical protein